LPKARKLESPLSGTAYPQWEARGLFRLVRRRCFTVEEIRKLIRIAPSEARELRETFGVAVATRAIAYRRAVFLHFELLASSANGGRR
jgi:hypothetical protein